MARTAWVSMLVLASACVSVTGPRAVRPGTTRFGGNLDVDTLTPLLQWEAEPGAEPAAARSEREPPVCYDLAVHEVEYEPGFSSAPGLWIVGSRVYYRECIPTTSHRLESPLLADRDYHWYVRSRRGAFVGPWSRFQYTIFVLLGGSTGAHYSYHLSTAGAAAPALADATDVDRERQREDEP